MDIHSRARPTIASLLVIIKTVKCYQAQKTFLKIKSLIKLFSSPTINF